MKRALITLRLLCDRCGCITNVDPLPDADAVPLDCWQAAIEDQALDLYSFASRNLAACAQCEARKVKLSVTNNTDKPITVRGAILGQRVEGNIPPRERCDHDSSRTCPLCYAPDQIDSITIEIA